MIALELPSELYERSFLDALAEFRDETGAVDPALAAVARQSFPEYLASRAALRVRETAPAGLVPATELWIIDADGYAGRISIRHELNEYLATYGGHIGYIIRPS